ncbi:MAG: type IX secretion system protein PorQ [Lacibacter sp.]
MLRFVLAISVLFILYSTSAQTLGGNSAYNFLRFPASPQTAAAGGINLSSKTNDLSAAFSNPAQLDSAMHSQMAANFNSLYAGVKNVHWMIAYRHPALKTNFAASVFYFDYGNTVQTDASGNILGSYKPRDFAVQLLASREYMNRWKYGLSLKFLSSNYGVYRSSAVAADVAVLYKDTASFLQVSVAAVNMGGQLRRYNSSEPEELPFDVQVGISKRLSKAPIQFSLTAHHLHLFHLNYNDTLFNNENGIANSSDKKFTIDKLFRHFVFSTQIVIGQRVEITAGYNYLRGKELRIYNSANGLTGFSFGVGMLLPKMQLRYARTQLQNNISYNQLGLNIPLNKYFGLGNWGERAGW